ncbi:MAG: VIT1/CCC1 transporter family protein [Fidelibacterota bacterium]
MGTHMATLGNLEDSQLSRILMAQRNEITEYRVYDRLSRSARDSRNRDLLKRISAEELEHYDFWKGHTGKELKPRRWMVWKYTIIARLLGLTFGIKLMEKGEERAQVTYEQIATFFPPASRIMEDEIEHERHLIGLMNEEKLKYVGSIVLGLNDALVELTGALAGLTLALQNTRLVAVAGLITGIAASLSMGASEYLSTRAEDTARTPLKASIYTGLAYLVTVLFLVFPYLVFEYYYLCLAVTLFNAIVVILIFTFYVSVVKDIPFVKRFVEMAVISLGIAAFTFGLGFAVRQFMGIEV